MGLLINELYKTIFIEILDYFSINSPKFRTLCYILCDSYQCGCSNAAKEKKIIYST